jgi:hypothetical protein
MNAKLSPIVFKWLRYAGITVSKKYIDDHLQSHPDYPALVSITDTLDELGIENISLVVDKEKLDELPVPFLAHSPLNGGGFVVINNIEQQIRQDKEFEKSWDDIVVLAAKPADWYHAENEKFLAKEKTIRHQIIIGIAAIVLLAGFTLFNYFTISLAGLLLASLAGLGIAILIVQQELGISNEITEQLCNAGKETDCNAVINFKGSKLSKWLNWADAGIIYFISFLLLLVASPANPLLSLLAAAAIPFIFFSVYYQWRVVKKWCTLCLLTLSILIVQFGLLLPIALNLVKAGTEIFTVNGLLFSVFVFTSTAAVWLLVIKPALQKNKQLVDKNYSLLRFKKNPDIFNALLSKQKKVDTTPFENDYQLGNPDACLQIMVACNPYCSPCAKAHEILHELVKKNDIGLTVRFSIKADNKEDKGTQAVEYILQLLSDNPNVNKRQILHDWYKVMDLEKFRHQYLLGNKGDVDVLLRLQDQWVEGAKIQFTPTIFINGYELPKQYRVNDLKWVVEKEEKLPETGKIEKTKIMH